MPTKQNNYKVVLKTSGLEYKAEAESIYNALNDLGLSWEQIKAKGVLTVSVGKTSYEHLFYLQSLRRIFSNKTTRMLWGKRLDLLLREGKEDDTIKKLDIK